MRILVTGAEGFIGQHLVYELSRPVTGSGQVKPHDVVGIDRAHGDLLQFGVARDLIGRYSPDLVIHLAAQVGRLFGEDDLMHTVETNVGMTALVAKACADAGAKLAYASTSEVYGDQGDSWLFEDTPLALPHNLYGVTKRAGEDVARLYVPDATILRLSMPYGPGLPHGRGRAAIVNFLWNAANGTDIEVHRGAERCWCWVGDTALGIRMAVEWDIAPDSDPWDSPWAFGLAERVWNIGRGDNPTTMLETARIACLIVSRGQHASASDRMHDLIREIDPPGMQTVVKRLSSAKLESIGWRPTIDLADGMRKTARAMGLAVDG